MPALSPHTDLIAGGWVSRLPSRLRPYALLARLDRPIGIWLLFLPGLWSIALVSSTAEVARLALLFLVGAVLMRAAGCTINDMWDRDLDRRVARTVSRPLAAGDISLRGAALFSPPC